MSKTAPQKKEELRNKLKLKKLRLKDELVKKHPQAVRFLKSKNLDPGKLREHSAKLLGAGLVAGALLLSPPSVDHLLPLPEDIYKKLNHDDNKSQEQTQAQKIITDTLAAFLPERPRPLYRNEEKFLEQVFENVLGVKTRATLEGEHLNTTYGKIGIEQHLKRYPGDSISEHGSGKVLRQGVAPGLGAWGYFAPSKDKLAPELADIEKWYAVVQTLYLPDWNTRQPYLKDWYKYRKLLIVNTQNGNAVVASIADSGPAMWTGKNFGGSPEVMMALGGDRYTKGKVIVFFVDDPENKVPLGKVEYNNIKLSDSI